MLHMEEVRRMMRPKVMFNIGEKAGYSSITALKLDDNRIWRSTATKDGKSVSVALDYQGNIVAM